MTYSQMQTAKNKTIDSILLSIESEIKKTYRFGRDSITSLVGDNYQKYLVGVDGADYYKTLATYNRLKTMEQEIKGVYIQIGKETRKTVTQGMYTTFDESYLMDRYITAFFSDQIGANIKYAAPNPIVREVAVTGDATRLTAIRDARLRRIAEGMIPPSGDTLTGILVNNLNNELTKTLRVVKQGLINGTSYTKQAQALKKTFDGNAYNALRVVRTEGNRLANAGTYLNSEDLKAEGVRIRRQWVATLDGRTRDSHQALDGQFEDDNGLFHIHGLSARYPGDFGDPAEDIQCRCTTIDVVPGLEPTLRRGVNPVTGKSDIASYKDYDTWKKEQPTAVAKNNITRNYDSDVAKKLGKDNYNELYDIIEKSDNKDATNLFNKYESEINIKDTNHSGGAYFNPNDEKIVFDIEKDRTGSSFTNPYQTFVHESGHAIDYKLGKNYDGGLHYSQGYNNNEFGKAIRGDVDTWAKSYKDEMLPEILKHMENKEYGAIWDKYGENIDLTTVIGGKKEYNIQWGYDRISRELEGLPHKSLIEISDIVEGATDGKCKVIVGHGEEYWRHKGMLETEAFAEMLSATLTNKDSLNVLKKYLPNAYSVFEKMIKEVL